MGEKETVAAVVVTYNRKDLLVECLDGILSQTKSLDAIFIIDNASTDGTMENLIGLGFVPAGGDGQTKPERLDSSNSLAAINRKKIYYSRLEKNMGGAGGFHEGIKRAFQEGFDWIWVMDDDVMPTSTALEESLRFIRDYSGRVAGISSLRVDKYTGKYWVDEIVGFNPLAVRTNHRFVRGQESLYRGTQYLKIKSSTLEGLLVNRRAIEKVGFPRTDFFIRADDSEYGFRLSSYGDLIHLTSSRVIKVAGGSNSVCRPSRNDVWKIQYSARNTVFWQLRCAETKESFITRIAAILFVLQYPFAVLKDQIKMPKGETSLGSLKLFALICSAVFDGIIGRLGKTF